VSEAVLANLQAKYHLDKPLWQQYLLYLQALLQGDLGASFRYADWSVNELVAKALPVSLAIGAIAMLLSLLLGVAAGILAALRQNTSVDHALMVLASAGHTLPSFVVGPLLVLVFAIGLRWFPAGGWSDFDPRYMVLPVALLVLINMATIARVMRGSLIEVLHSPYIRTAHAKGLPLRLVVMRHALKPALLPVVSLMGPLCISSITSALVTETVFSLPGLGRLAFESVVQRDLNTLLGIVLISALLVILVNFVVDLLYAKLDPRIGAR